MANVRQQEQDIWRRYQLDALLAAAGANHNLNVQQWKPANRPMTDEEYAAFQDQPQFANDLALPPILTPGTVYEKPGGKYLLCVREGNSVSAWPVDRSFLSKLAVWKEDEIFYDGCREAIRALATDMGFKSIKIGWEKPEYVNLNYLDKMLDMAKDQGVTVALNEAVMQKISELSKEKREAIFKKIHDLQDAQLEKEQSAAYGIARVNVTHDHLKNNLEANIKAAEESKQKLESAVLDQNNPQKEEAVKNALDELRGNLQKVEQAVTEVNNEVKQQNIYSMAKKPMQQSKQPTDVDLTSGKAKEYNDAVQNKLATNYRQLINNAKNKMDAIKTYLADDQQAPRFNNLSQPTQEKLKELNNGPANILVKKIENTSTKIDTTVHNIQEERNRQPDRFKL